MKKILALLLINMIGCTKFVTPSPILQTSDNWIVKAQAFIPVVLEKNDDNSIHLMAVVKTSTSIPVTVTLAANVQFNLSTSSFNVPSNLFTDTLDFGNLNLTTLRDNNLKVCGGGGNQKCTQAAIRFYTTGGGTGLWNSGDSYGSPLTVTKSGSSSQSIGLTSSNSAIVSTYTIPSNKNVVKLSDFTGVQSYNIQSDFSNAGSGTYSTTLVVEYILQ